LLLIAANAWSTVADPAVALHTKLNLVNGEPGMEFFSQFIYAVDMIFDGY